MHRSCLAGFIIDCQTADLAGAASFWGAALGMATESFSGEEGEIYVGLQSGERDLHIEVQKVAHPSRVHLDIAADDIPAEVARLEALGARRVGEVKNWVVMEAPTGQRFCVVSARGAPGFERHARTWP